MSADHDIPLILPLCVFPSVAWTKLALSSNSVIDIHEHYVKQTYRNRYDIAGVNGLIRLTIPVEGQKGQKIPYHQIRIADQEWKKQHLASIRSAYGRAAYFEHYYPELAELVLNGSKNLCELGQSILAWIISTGIPLHTNYSQTHVETTGIDYRDKFEPVHLWPPLPSYAQVFSDRFEFMSNLSVIDLIMNRGPSSSDYLATIQIK